MQLQNYLVNVCGLNNEEKGFEIQNFLQSWKADIIYLQALGNKGRVYEQKCHKDHLGNTFADQNTMRRSKNTV